MKKLASLLIILSLALACCRTGSVNNTGITFLTLKGPSAMGMIYLMDSPGKIIDVPINIEMLDEPMMVRARILKDKPELAVLPLNMASILYNKGLPYQVIAVPVWGTLYLFGTDSTINGWPSLKNKKIYLMGKGTTPDILFRYLLKNHGLDPAKDVVLDYSFPTHIDLANAVAAGQAQLAVISEPMVSLAKARNPRIHQLMDMNAEWAAAMPGNPEMPQTALVGSTDFIKKHPGWVKKICEAWMRSINEVNQHPELAAKRIVFHKILPDPSIAVSSIPRCNLRFRYASEIRSGVAQYLQVFYTFNPDATGGKLPDEQFICQKPDY